MIIIGITGTIATGKSTLVNLLSNKGYKVFDSDKTASEVLKNEFVVNSIKSEFKNIDNLLTEDGQIYKVALRDYVLGDERRLKKLENITHPYIRKKEMEFVKNCAINRKNLIFLDIPLLLETKYYNRCDFIINLQVYKNVQKHRALKRENMSDKKFNFLYEKQKKMNTRLIRIFHANINTGNGIMPLRRKIYSFLKKITKINKKKVWPLTYYRTLCEK